MEHFGGSGRHQTAQAGSRGPLGHDFVRRLRLKGLNLLVNKQHLRGGPSDPAFYFCETDPLICETDPASYETDEAHF